MFEYLTGVSIRVLQKNVGKPYIASIIYSYICKKVLSYSNRNHKWIGNPTIYQKHICYFI